MTIRFNRIVISPVILSEPCASEESPHQGLGFGRQVRGYALCLSWERLSRACCWRVAMRWIFRCAQNDSGMQRSVVILSELYTGEESPGNAGVWLPVLDWCTVFGVCTLAPGMLLAIGFEGDFSLRSK